MTHPAIGPERATTHALATYAPAPESQRRGIALCLSGGGYRAALFHLGALRRLNELGVLAAVDAITAVSGGSITAAVLARAMVSERLAAAGGLRDFDGDVARPLRAFTARNIRTPALLRRLLPWNWLRDDAGVRALADAYRTLVPGFHCSELPARPQFVFCSTDMAFGVNWTYERTRIGDFQAGYMAPRPRDSVAVAVAASSCFPPIFNPLRPRLDPAALTRGTYRGPDRARIIRGLRLTDGGDYDNLGLEPVWKRRAVVLVSDGGGPFGFSADRGIFWRVQRYTAILDKQVGALRKRWLISSFLTGTLRGTYWGIASSATHYDAGAPGYPEHVSKELIAQIRTDLDSFSDGEAAVLENHGYALADAAVQRHVPALITDTQSPFRVPHPEWDWSHLARVERALASSHKRRLLGRW